MSLTQVTRGPERSSSTCAEAIIVADLSHAHHFSFESRFWSQLATFYNSHDEICQASIQSFCSITFYKILKNPFLKKHLCGSTKTGYKIQSKDTLEDSEMFTKVSAGLSRARSYSLLFSLVIFVNSFAHVYFRNRPISK